MSDNHGPTEEDMMRAIWGCLGTLVVAIALLGVVWFALMVTFS